MKNLSYSQKPVHMLATALLVPLWIFFGYRHIDVFLNTNELAYLFLFISETLTVGFLLTRAQPKSISTIPLDWIIAIIGTFSTLLLAPTSWGIFPQAKYAIMFGTFLQILGIISLNRSFALVAANREIKTNGMYRLIRHPLYSSYFITFTAYLLCNTSIDNFLFYTFAAASTGLRIFREEEHLALDNSYKEYMQKVKYRIIPFVF